MLELLNIILWGAVIGVCSGFLAGLLGVGGGLIIVPALIVLLPQWGLAPALATHAAIATSLASIIGTGLISVHAHQRLGAVRWDIVKWFVPGLLLGAMAGAHTANLLSGAALQAVFGGLMIALALLMVRKPSSKLIAAPAEQTPTWSCLPAGGVIAWASALAGIGGGSLTVPFLHHRRVVITHAIGTAATCGVPLALAGTAGFVFIEPTAQVSAELSSALLPGMTGFVLWPAAAGIVASSLVTARLGAHWAHRLQARYLKIIFAVFLVLIGIQLLYSASL